MDNLFERLKEFARDNPNGFTVYIKNLSRVKSGYAVALIETQNCFGDEGLAKVISVTNEKTGIVGGWGNDGKF